MDINKVPKNLPTQINEARPADSNKKAGAVSHAKNQADFSDKVSIDQSRMSKNEVLFAKIELAKLNDSSFEKLKSMKADLTEYENAKEISDEKAAETKIGKMLNNPNVWDEIARKML